MTARMQSIVIWAASGEMAASPCPQSTVSPPLATRKCGVVSTPSLAMAPNARTSCTIGNATLWPNDMKPQVEPS